MANCGCKPCAKPVDNTKKRCKPFSICVGNYTFIWDGECPSIVPRQYQIPDGTYTSLTFEGGCVVGVGQAPIPVYTPQSCCGDTPKETTPTNNGGGSSLTASHQPGNLVDIANNALTVKVNFKDSDTVTVRGNGTAGKPFIPSIKLSSDPNNRLSIKDDGLMANVAFRTSDNVKITGAGTSLDPYMLSVTPPKNNLPEIHENEYDLGVFSVDEYGRVKGIIGDKPPELVSNLSSKTPLIKVTKDINGTALDLDKDQLVESLDLKTDTSLTGNGTADKPFSVAIKTKETLEGDGTALKPLGVTLRTGVGLKGKGTQADPLSLNVFKKDGVLGDGSETDPFRVDVAYLVSRLREFGYELTVPKKDTGATPPKVPTVTVEGTNVTLSGLDPNKKVRLVYYNGDNDGGKYLLGDVEANTTQDGGFTKKLPGLPADGQVLVVVDDKLIWSRY